MHDPNETGGRRDAVLHALMTGVIAGIETSLVSVAPFRQVIARPKGVPVCMDIEGWLWLLDDNLSVMRGALEQPVAGGEVLFGFDPAGAVTLAAGVMSTPRSVLQQQLEEGLPEWYDEALAEIGNVLCSGVNRVLRRRLDTAVGLRFRDSASVRPGFDQFDILGQGEKVIFDYVLQIEDHPKSHACVILDAEVAEIWNGGVPACDQAGSMPATPPATDHGLRPSGLAPDARRLSALIVGGDTASIVQACAARLGLEFSSRTGSDVSSPAARHGDLVVIEIPVGEDKRFEWARRIKEQFDGIVVVLLIHEPSRARVIQGCMTMADTVVAWPSMEPQLFEKLAAAMAKSAIQP